MRWILRIALTLFTLLIVAVAALFLIPTDRIARIAEAEFEKTTGRQLFLAGEVQPQVFPRLGVVLNDVTIANADWAGGDPMLKADRLEVGVTLAALMGGEVNVEAFALDGPQIRLIRNTDGTANWDFIADIGGGADEPPGDTPAVSLPKGTITNATVSYVDRQSGLSETLTGLTAELGLPDLRGEATISLTATRNGQPFSVDASVDGMQQLLDGDQRTISMKFGTGGSTASFDGIGQMTPLQAKGSLNADVADPKSLFALLGATMPRIPEGMGQHTRLDADVTFTSDNELFLRDAVLQLDQNRFQGNVDVALREKPQITAQLVADRVDFSAMSTDTTEEDGAANAGSGGWSEARLDVSGLSAVDGSFSLKANAIDLGSIQLARTDMRGTLNDSRLVLDLTEVGVFDGNVGGQFVVNGRGGLSVRGDLQARGVAMQRLLQDFAGYDRLVADAGMRLTFLGVGANMDELMKSLDGEGAIDVGSGALLGLDIAGMIKNLDTSYRGEGEKTVFDDITGTFTISDGVLRNSDLNFVAALLTATGEGEVDLGAQTINYRLDPTALASKIEKGIRVPILIEGPWSNIRFRPDLKSLIDTELEAEKEKLKAQAKAKEEELKAQAKVREAELKAKAAAKLQDELGVTQGQDQGVEDALKDSLENKLKEGLGRLLGGN